MGVHVTANSVSVDPVVDVPDRATVPGLILERARTRPAEPIVEFYSPTFGRWRTLSAGRFGDLLLTFGAEAIRWGIAEGDRVAILGRSGLDWNLLDLALQAIGAVSVPIYDTSSPAQIAAIVNKSQVTRGFADDEHAHLLTDAGVEVRTFSHMAGLAPYLSTETPLDFAPVLERLARRRGDEVATEVYSSGTTGEPRAVALTHYNLAGMLLQEEEFFPQAIRDAEIRCMLFLPMAHVFARTAAYMPLAGYGVEAHVDRAAGSLVDNFAQFRPTTIGAVPRVLEKIEESARAQAKTPFQRKVFAWAQRVSRRRAPYVRADKRAPARIQIPYRLAKRLVLGKIIDGLGGQLRCVVSGGAPLDPQLDDFFTGMGVRVCNGYGLTESTGGFFCNTFTAARAGTAGRPLPGCAVRRSADGELELKGIGVFSGYLHDEDANADAFTEDGWFRSGDLGTFDADGFVSITGRKKDIIVTAGGKNVHPGPVEEAVRQHPLISQVMVLGEGRKFVSALVTLNSGVDAAAAEVRQQVAAAFAEANRRVSRAESVRRFHILTESFTEANGLLTPSLKIKRNEILRRFATDIEALYGGTLGFDIRPSKDDEPDQRA